MKNNTHQGTIRLGRPMYESVLGIKAMAEVRLGRVVSMREVAEVALSLVNGEQIIDRLREPGGS